MTSGITCTVYTRPGGSAPLVPMADGSPGEDPLTPTVLSDLKISWGRETTIDQPAASTCTFQIYDPAGGSEFYQQIALGTPIVVTATWPGMNLTVTVFTGRVTSMTHQWIDDAPVATVNAADFTADLENTIVGDTPWPREMLTQRFARIAALTTLSDWTIPESLDEIVSWRDVDAQGAMGLFSELAQSVDGVLWSATSEDGLTTRLVLEDPRNRENVSTVYVSACDVNLDGVTWVKDVQDVTSRVSVTWLEQDRDANGNTIGTTDRTVTVVDDIREELYGRRSLSLSSQLENETNATDVARYILDRTAGNWRVTGLTIDDAIAGPHTPGAVAINYVPDPSGEYDGITWATSQAPTRTINSGQAHTGYASYQYDQILETAYIQVAVPEGATSVTVSAWYRAYQGISTATYQLYVAGSGAVAKTSPVYATGNSQIYQRRTLTTPAVPGGVVNFYPVRAGEIPAGDRVIVDDLSIAFDTEDADFNGDTEPADGYTYTWEGTPGASPSLRTSDGSAEAYALAVLRMLDVNNRNGLPIVLTDFPTWPATGSTHLNLEGGSYTFSGGAWILDLTVSTSSATLEDLHAFVPGTLADFPVVYGTDATLETIYVTPIYV